MDQTDRPRSAVVLTIDGLRPPMLGPYGNTWFETPNFNRLAAQSRLFEQCIVDCPDPGFALRSMWNGLHVCQVNTNNPHLIRAIGESDIETILITADLPRVTDHPDDGFDQVFEVDIQPPRGLASSFDATQLATFFAGAIEVIEAIEPPALLWLNCQGLTTAWDAPYTFREQLADSEDPDPPDLFLPPDLEFNPASDDPDQLLGFQQAYGAQIVLLDQFLGVLLDQLARTTWGSEALFCLTSGRGYPLGEHGVVGFYRPILNAELVHVPLIIRWPKQTHPGFRDRSLVQTGSLYRLLGQWFDCVPTDALENPAFPKISVHKALTRQREDAICSLCQSEEVKYQSIQTQAWKFIRGAKQQLFVRPDDQWEVNEIGSLCPEVVRELDQMLTVGIERLRSGQPFLEPPLAEPSGIRDELADGG